MTEKRGVLGERGEIDEENNQKFGFSFASVIGRRNVWFCDSVADAIQGDGVICHQKFHVQQGLYAPILSCFLWNFV